LRTVADHRRLLRAQPPDPPLGADVAGALELVGQQPVAELRVVTVRVGQGFSQTSSSSRWLTAVARPA
jgi:hypothetical protein